MKKLSEVSKIIGVTRRTLQEYDKIGLLHPTSKSESGYWLYDDETIQKLMFIQIFVEAGYERKRIKALLESDNVDLNEEYKNVISILKDKRRRIDGMINTVETIQTALALPLSTIKALAKTDLTRLYKDRSFSEYLEDTIEHTASYTEEDRKDAAAYLPVWYMVSAIGCLKEQPADSKEVQECILDFLHRIIEMGIIDEEDETDSIKDMPEEAQLYMVALAMSEAVGEWFDDSELTEMLNVQCGEGSLEFIKNALDTYCELHKYVETKFDLGEVE